MQNIDVFILNKQRLYFFIYFAHVTIKNTNSKLGYFCKTAKKNISIDDGPKPAQISNSVSQKFLTAGPICYYFGRTIEAFVLSLFLYSKRSKVTAQSKYPVLQQEPLCSTFKFENLHSPKKLFLPKNYFFKNLRKEKKIFLCNFFVQTLQCF